VILAADDDAAFQPDLTGRVDNDRNT
jgi:hypothetical protein